VTRALSFILGLAMVVHVIRPLGLPGLKTRADVWKIAVFALLAIAAVAVLKEE
jgi:hypothetical protein